MTVLNTITIEEMWDALLEMGVSEETIQTVTTINGYNEKSMTDILYSRFGYNNFEQLND